MGLPSHDHLAEPGSGIFRAGDVLDGRYRIQHVIAEGGVAIVVAAEQLGLDRHVAIKLLRRERLLDRHFVEHFKSEGSLAAKIKSEHVVRIHDVGEGAGIGPYMVMELLEGQDLEQILQQGPRQMEEAIDYVLQACDALVEAHHLRIVHRDIKPANLFLASRAPRPPILKIIDFGISKVLPRGTEGESLEPLAGTPAYMSPEQIIHGSVVDARADIWALGVVLFELLTGQLPFGMDAPERMLEKICTTRPTPLRALCPQYPEELERIILKCLARDVSQRYGTIVDLANALAPFRGVRDMLKSSGEIDPHAYTDPRRQAPTVVVAPAKASSSRTVLFASIGLVALAAVGTGLIFAARASRSNPTPASAEPAATASIAAPIESGAPPPEAASEIPSAIAEASPSASAPPTARAKGHAVAPAKVKPSGARHKAGSVPSNDRSMFGERK